MEEPDPERHENAPLGDRTRRAFGEWCARLLDGSMRARGWVHAAAIMGVLAASWFATYALGGAGHVPPHFFYIGILLGAVRFGLPGAIIVAVASGILAGPLMPHDVGEGTSQPASDWVSRAAFFVLMGAVPMAWAIGRFRRALHRELGVRMKERELAGRSAAMIQSVSHEFRTPMTVLSNGIDLLRSVDLDPAQRLEVTDGLTTALRRLDNLTTMVMETSEVFNEPSPTDRPVDVNDVCREAVAGLGNDSAVERVVVPDGRVLVVTDPRLLAIVLRSLLENALRFSPPGTPVLVTTTRRESFVEIAIRDEGPGIDPIRARRSLEAPFDPERETAATGGGLGLGLFAANQAIKRIGATLEFHTPDEGGTTAVIAIPTGAPPPDEAPHEFPTDEARS